MVEFHNEKSVRDAMYCGRNFKNYDFSIVYNTAAGAAVYAKRRKKNVHI